MVANIFEITIYCFGIYMILVGGCACYIKMRCIGGKCCITLFQFFLLVLVVVCVVLSIFPIMVYGISEEDVDWFCKSSIDQLDDELTSSYKKDIKKARRFVMDIDTFLDGRSDTIMCRRDFCPCNINDWTYWLEPNPVDETFLEDYNEANPSAGEYGVGGDVTNWHECVL